MTVTWARRIIGSPSLPVCVESWVLLQLFIAHHHYRPGGVRRVIELATPAVVLGAPGPVTGVWLLGGEAPRADWLARFARALGPVPLRMHIVPELGYLTEQPATPLREWRLRVRAALGQGLPLGAERGDLLWVHNPGLGRNGRVGDELRRWAGALGMTVVFHHHDWWFDNRWQRWADLCAAGFRTPGAVAGATLPTEPSIVHLGINREDVTVLRRGFGDRAGWLPNPVELEAAPAVSTGVERRRELREWVARQCAGDGDARLWVLPCRFLRRKNVGEAILLARWLRPDAWLLTTAAASSREEMPAFERLVGAARGGDWRVRLGVLAEPVGGTFVRAPSVPELYARSEMVLFTSILEGFGLPYLEAAAAGRPLLARALPNVVPDLRRLGFRFPLLYSEVRISVTCFDLRAEQRRQETLFQAWRERLPAAYRACVGKSAPWPLQDGPKGPLIAFSRLTLTAQLEVLVRDPQETWRLCAPANPWLGRLRRALATGPIPATPWPLEAAARLAGPAYGRRFWRICRAALRAPAPRPGASLSVQGEFVRQRLDPARFSPSCGFRNPEPGREPRRAPDPTPTQGPDGKAEGCDLRCLRNPAARGAWTAGCGGAVGDPGARGVRRGASAGVGSVLSCARGAGAR